MLLGHSQDKFPWINTCTSLRLSWLCPSTCSLILFFCYNKFFTSLRLFSPSHPSRQLKNRQNCLKRNGITKQFSSPLPHFPRNLSLWLLVLWPFLGIFAVRCCFKPFVNVQHPRAASFSKEEEQRTTLMARKGGYQKGKNSLGRALPSHSTPPKL